MTIRHRLLAFLRSRRRTPVPPVEDYTLRDSVPGATRSPQEASWRLIGRDEDPLEGLLAPGSAADSLPGLQSAAGDVLAADPFGESG